MRHLLSVLLLLSLGSQALANSALTGESETSTEKRKWTALVDVNHTFRTLDRDLQPRADQQRGFSVITARADIDLSKRQVFRVSQSFQKLYEIDSDTPEFSAYDTMLTHIWRMPWKYRGVSFQWFNNVSLPLSQRSETDEKITHINSQMRMNYVWRKNFFSFRPFVRHSWYRYKNTISGRSLPFLNTGASLLALFPVTKKIALIGIASYSQVFESNSALAGGLVQENLEGDRYGFLGLVNFQATKRFSGYVTYSQGDTVLQDGRYQIVLNDPNTTRYGAGLTYIY